MWHAANWYVLFQLTVTPGGTGIYRTKREGIYLKVVCLTGTHHIHKNAFGKSFNNADNDSRTRVNNFKISTQKTHRKTKHGIRVLSHSINQFPPQHQTIYFLPERLVLF